MHAGEMKEFGANCWKNHLCKLSAQKVCWLFSIPQRCTRRRTRTVARMKISCRGRAFLSADLSVHLPDKRARAMYVYYAKDVNKQTDRQAARRQSFRIKRAASANELRRAQKAVVSSAQRIEKKVNSVKSRLRSRNFSHRTTKADGPSALNIYPIPSFASRCTQFTATSKK
jgi:hypothetical protein